MNLNFIYKYLGSIILPIGKIYNYIYNYDFIRNYIIYIILYIE